MELNQTKNTITINQLSVLNNNNKLFYDNPHNFLELDEVNIKPISFIPSIKIKIQDFKTKAILDTAAEISLIKTEKALKLKDFDKCVDKIKKIELISANQKKMGQISQKIITLVEINNKSYLMEFYLYDQIPYNCLIGVDNIKKYDMILDFEKEQLKIQDNYIKFEKVTEFCDCIIEEEKEEEKLSKEGKSVEINEERDIYNINQREYYDDYYLNENEEEDYEENKENDIIKNERIIINEYNKKGYIQELVKKIEIKEEVRERLKEILLDNSITYNDEITFARNYEHNIQINDETPLQCKNYPIPFHFRYQVNTEIEKLIKQGIIERSNSYFISPIVIVKKSDNSLRICLDAREINKRIKPGFETPQTIEVLMGKCGTSKWYTKIDLKSAFWLIKLGEDSKKYCAFNINGNIYQFKVTPFGMKCSPSALIRFLHKILNKYEDFCVHYFDDILIFSHNEEDHLRHLNVIFSTLAKEGMKINLDKSQFFKTEVNYLGHLVNQKGIQLDTKRIQQIHDYPRPRRIRDIRAFLGLINYYHRFIKDYAKKTYPLLKLVKKNVSWKWTLEQEQAFKDLKESFITELLLYRPNFKFPFILKCDASNHAVAGELSQVQDEVEVPIQFVSRILKPCEIKYSITSKEMLAIIYSISKLRHYLLGKKFKIETDHIALISILNGRIDNNRVYRWSLMLNEYDFEIIYKPGKEMIVPDILSRKYTHKSTTEIMISNVRLYQRGFYSYKRIREVQTDTNIQDLKRKLSERNEFKGYYLEEYLVKKKIGNKSVIVITPKFLEEISLKLHQSYCHIGIRKLWLMIREAFYCINDYKIIKEVIKFCHQCQLSKEKNYHLEPDFRNIIPENKLDLVAIDYLSNLPRSSKGYKNVLVIYDIYTKFTQLIPTEKCNTETTLCGLNTFITEFGKPKAILTDNATYFNNERFRETLNNIGIKTYYSSIRHPQSNPSERIIKEVIKYLRIILEDNHHLWVKKIKIIESLLNDTPNTTHLESPILLMTGHPPKRNWKNEETINIDERLAEVKEKLINKARYRKRQQDKKKRRTIIFNINDLVLVRTLRVTDVRRKVVAKLTKPYQGPYKIISRVGDTYELMEEETETSKGKFHASSLIKYQSK